MRKTIFPQRPAPISAPQQVAQESGRSPTTGRVLMWQTKTKAAIQSTTSNTVLLNDNTLFFPMLINRTYRVQMFVTFTMGAAEDFKYDITGPASPTAVALSAFDSAPLAVPAARALATTYAATARSLTGASAGTSTISVDGTITNGATAGNFQLRWAQVVSGVTLTSVLRGSYIQFTEIV